MRKSEISRLHVHQHKISLRCTRLHTQHFPNPKCNSNSNPNPSALRLTEGSAWMPLSRDGSYTLDDFFNGMRLNNLQIIHSLHYVERRPQDTSGVPSQRLGRQPSQFLIRLLSARSVVDLMGCGFSRSMALADIPCASMSGEIKSTGGTRTWRFPRKHRPCGFEIKRPRQPSKGTSSLRNKQLL